ncbi:claudin-34-like [Aplochiton taeniatus]
MYLSHTAHPQFVGLWLGCLGWTLTAMTMGFIQWRVWLVQDVSLITSGLAWVGVWRACFYSHALETSRFTALYCRRIGPRDAFTPPEIAAAQVLMLLASAAGICGNASAAYALRNVYFGLGKEAPVRSAFCVAGALSLTSAALSLVPLLWNLHSVVANRTIHFPPEFHFPPAPVEQWVGSGIVVGILASALLAVSGLIFLIYRLPSAVTWGTRVQPSLTDGTRVSDGTLTHSRVTVSGLMTGKDNPAYYSEEHSSVRQADTLVIA